MGYVKRPVKSTKFRPDAACECGHPWAEHAKASRIGECMVYLVDATDPPFWCQCKMFTPTGLTCYPEKIAPGSRVRYIVRGATSYEAILDDSDPRFVKDKYGNVIGEEYRDQYIPDPTPAKVALENMATKYGRTKYGKIKINWPAPSTLREKMAPREWAKPETPKGLIFGKYGFEAKKAFEYDTEGLYDEPVRKAKRVKKAKPKAPKLDKLNLTRMPPASDDEL